MVLPGSYEFELQKSQEGVPKLTAAEIKRMQDNQLPMYSSSARNSSNKLLQSVGRNLTILAPINDSLVRYSINAPPPRARNPILQDDPFLDV